MVTTVVFDIGGVLVDWNPRHLYGPVFGEDSETMERFLAEVCTSEWHLAHDRGVPFVDNRAALLERHPDHAELITMWGDRFLEMAGHEVPGTVSVLEELEGRVRLLGLSNMPAEVMAGLLEKFPFLRRLEGIVCSGEERLIKPDPAIYEVLVSRYELVPGQTLFVDDVERNIAAARAAGLRGHVFTSAEGLRVELQALGVL